MARAPRDTLPDKPWIAADSSSGALLLSYTTFYSRPGGLGDRIDLQRSEDGGATWSPPGRLSSDAEEGLVQGSRPVFGPDGEAHVVWAAVDTTAAAHGLDFMRMRTSRDGGRSLPPRQLALEGDSS